jgi:RimJ/RimL family protein N-acetyltransferase
MQVITVRHFTEADIPIRNELQREARFQTNLIDIAVSTDEDGLAATQRRTIHEEHHTKRIFTMCGRKGQVVGFAWITSIDWRSQRCELSFGVLPRYRGGLGALAVQAVQFYLRAELNMRVVVNQVLEHNTMLLSAEKLAARRQVRCDFDSYTVGEWRAACYWSLTDHEVQALVNEEETRRRTIAERIRATTRKSS